MTKISIIGPGRVGGALAIALSGRGFVIDSIVARNYERASAIIEKIGGGTRIVGPDRLDELRGEIILITTRDDQIAEVALELASHPPAAGTKVLHTSGSRTSEVLTPIRNAGAHTGSFHPLVSISEPFLGSTRFKGVYFCIEGDSQAVSAANEIAVSLGGKPFEIPTDKKPLYHAAAVMACGHVVALISEAVEMLSKCGPDEAESKRILLPLIDSTLQNLHEQAFEEALTGPFARADIETFRSHLSAFEGELSEEVLFAYLLLGQRSLEIARKKDPASSNFDRFAGMIHDLLSRRYS